MAFDRLAAAARGDGLSLVTSAYRSDAEQARLYAAHPDPRGIDGGSTASRVRIPPRHRYTSPGGRHWDTSAPGGWTRLPARGVPLSVPLTGLRCVGPWRRGACGPAGVG